MDILELIEQKEKIIEERKTRVRKKDIELEDVFLGESVLAPNNVSKKKKNVKVMVKKR